MHDIDFPHDKFFRAAMSDIRVAKAYFQEHLPPMILERCKLSTLCTCQETFVSETLRHHLTDILFSADFVDCPGYLYLLSEHFRNAKRLTPFTLLTYVIQIMDNHLRKHNTEILPVVYPIVLYNGTIQYNQSMSLWDLFGDPALGELAKNILLGPYQLVDLNKIPDEDLKKNHWTAILEMSLKHACRREITQMIQELSAAIRTVYSKNGNFYMNAALTYLFDQCKVKNKTKVWDTIGKISPNSEDDMATMAQLLREEGREEIREEIRTGTGTMAQLLREEGREEGIAYEQMHIAKNLLKREQPAAFIAEVTGLTLTEVNQLREEPVETTTT